jgi:hypothetical protein
MRIFDIIILFVGLFLLFISLQSGLALFKTALRVTNNQIDTLTL